MTIKCLALPTARVADLLTGGPDANGQLAERTISNGHGNECRHCLQEIPAGASMLVLAYRPFSLIQPYAEVLSLIHI